MSSAAKPNNTCPHCTGTAEKRHFGPDPKPTTVAEALRALAHNMGCVLRENCEQAADGAHVRFDVSPVLGGHGCHCFERPVPVKAKPGPEFYAAQEAKQGAALARLGKAA